MTIQDIENLTFAELKASGKKIIDELGGNELAARYVQARTDAKQRDEKLAEQGVTITNLNALLEKERAATKAALAKLSQLEATLAERTIEREQAKEAAVDLLASITEQRERGDRLKAEAERNFKALSTAEKALKDAMAARELDAAERG